MTVWNKSHAQLSSIPGYLRPWIWWGAGTKLIFDRKKDYHTALKIASGCYHLDKMDVSDPFPLLHARPVQMEKVN